MENFTTEKIFLFPVVKFRTDPRKIGPPKTFGGRPLKPKNPAYITDFAFFIYFLVCFIGWISNWQICNSVPSIEFVLVTFSISNWMQIQWKYIHRKCAKNLRILRICIDNNNLLGNLLLTNSLIYLVPTKKLNMMAYLPWFLQFSHYKIS